RLGDDASDVWIGGAEEDRLRVAPHREIRHEGIVGVEDQRGRRGKSGERIADLLRERIELEVAIHLIAEEIRDHDDTRLQSPDGTRKRRLIDFEETEVAARLPRPGRVLEERRGDATIEIRAGPVMNRIPPGRPRDVREHPRGRGLPVRPGDARDAKLELGGERADEVGVEREGDESGKRGRPAPGRTKSFAGDLAGCVGDESERVRHERSVPACYTATGCTSRSRSSSSSIARPRRSATAFAESPLAWEFSSAPWASRRASTATALRRREI